jgi:hypothetical protein
MANDNSGPIVRIDTFGADVVIGAGYARVSMILVTAYSSAKSVAFIDSSGGEVMKLECPSGETYSVTFSQPFDFQNGLIFDDSASDLAAGDKLYVYLA